MKIEYTFRHMEASKTAEEFVESKLPKVQRLLEKEMPPITLHVTLDARPTHDHHRVEMILKSHNYDITVHHEGPELYAEIEHVADKLVHEIAKEKEKRIDEIKQRSKPNA